MGDGDSVGDGVGTGVGEGVGSMVGVKVVGSAVGAGVGLSVGAGVGPPVIVWHCPEIHWHASPSQSRQAVASSTGSGTHSPPTQPPLLHSSATKLQSFGSGTAQDACPRTTTQAGAISQSEAGQVKMAHGLGMVAVVTVVAVVRVAVRLVAVRLVAVRLVAVPVVLVVVCSG